MLDFLERKLGRLAIPNVTTYLIVGQVFVFLSSLLGLLDLRLLLLHSHAGIGGQPWRFVSFLFIPPPFGEYSMMLLPFAWWLFFLMGNALEEFWGTFRYNLFWISGALLTIGVSFLDGSAGMTNYHLMLAVSLVFAWLNPDFVLNLFFVLPLKMKWIAMVSLAFMVRDLVRGASTTRWEISASVATILLFIGSDIVNTIRYRRRTMAVQAKRAADERKGPEARHRCHVCGKTDLTNPEMDFRYCSKCAGDQCYCPEHIFSHEHVTEESAGAKG